MSFKVVFQCIATAILALAGSLTAFANQSVIVDCRQGGQPVVTSGLTSTTKVLQSFPSCTITVSIHGGGTATIFSDNSGTPLANPFTAQNNPYPGAGFFYAANGRYDITISGGGITSPLTFSDILLNDPATLTGCAQLPALTGDVTSAGGTCATVLPNVASAGTGLKTTINAKGQATGVTTAASTDLSDSSIIARLNAAANFGINPISSGPVTGTAASFTSVADNGETVAGEIAPDVTGRQLGDVAHRWDAFIRNLDVSGSITGGITGSGTTNNIPKFTGTSSIGNSSLTDNGTSVSTSEIFSAGSYSNNLSAFAPTTSAQLAGIITDESGTGALLFANGNIGAATGTSVNLTGTGTFAGLVNANGGINVSKVVHDARADGVKCDNLTDDSAAITLALTNAYAAGQGAVQFPSGQCIIGTTVNDTNKPSLDIIGANSNEAFSNTGIPGQNYGITQTQFICNTGNTPCWDATGTGRQRMKNFSMRAASSQSAPSQIGILFARDNAPSGTGPGNTTGWTTGTGTFCFPQANHVENVWIFFDSRPAATAVGNVGILDIGAEGFQLSGGGIIADAPTFFSSSNLLAIASPYQTIVTGCPLSMTEVTIGPRQSLAGWTRPAIDLRGVIDFFSFPDTEILNNGPGTNHNPAVNINVDNGVPTNLFIHGQDEGFDQPFSAGTSINNLYLEMTAVAPVASGLITLGTGVNVKCCKIAIPQINGTVQPLINPATGVSSMTGMIISENGNSGSSSGASNITLTGSTVYAPGLADGVVNTFNASSTYTVYDSTGMSTIGSYKFANSLGVGAAALASVGILENNSALTGTTQTGVQSAPSCSSTATNACEGMRSRFDTAAAAFTVPTGAAIHVVEGVKGVGSTITTESGLLIDTLSNGGTNFAIQTGANPSSFGGQIQSTVTTGTAPFSVVSTTNVPNLNASSLSGATFASPGAIGGTTPSTGAFTTLSSTGTFTPSQTNGIVGTTTNNNANAGSVGEVISSTIATGSSVTLSTGTTANITSVSLTAGDWDCTGAVDFTFGANTSYTNLVGGISTTSATLGAQDSKFDFETPAAVPTAGADATFPLPIVRQQLSGTTTVFLVTQGTFTLSTLKAYGTIRCRRMR